MIKNSIQPTYLRGGKQLRSLHSRLFVYKTSVQDSLSRGFADVTFSDFFLRKFRTV